MWIGTQRECIVWGCMGVVDMDYSFMNSRLLVRFAVMLSVVFGVLMGAGVVIGRIEFETSQLILYQVGAVSNGFAYQNGLYLWDSKRNVRYQFQTGCQHAGFGWSPDGNEIALAADCPDESPGVYVMDSDGRNLRRLAEGSPTFGRVQWSADSAYLFYHDYQPLSSQIVSLALRLDTGERSMYAIRDLISGKFDVFPNEVVDPSDYPPFPVVTIPPELMPPVPEGWRLLQAERRPVSE